MQIISWPPERMTNVGEATFAKKLLAEGLRYIYQPKAFMMRPPFPIVSTRLLRVDTAAVLRSHGLVAAMGTGSREDYGVLAAVPQR